MTGVDKDLATLREALFHATRSTSALDRSPVPGSPIGDAHLALDRVEAELSRLREQRDALEHQRAWGAEENARLRDERDELAEDVSAERDAHEAGRHLLKAAEARCAELERERDAAMDAVGLPRTASLDDLIRHHRGNAATAAGFDQIAAQARCARLQQALVHHGYGPRLCKCANCVAAGPDTPADSQPEEPT